MSRGAVSPCHWNSAQPCPRSETLKHTCTETAPKRIKMNKSVKPISMSWMFIGVYQSCRSYDCITSNSSLVLGRDRCPVKDDTIQSLVLGHSSGGVRDSSTVCHLMCDSSTVCHLMFLIHWPRDPYPGPRLAI